MSKRAVNASRAGVNATSTDESRTREIAKSVVRRNATGIFTANARQFER